MTIKKHNLIKILLLSLVLLVIPQVTFAQSKEAYLQITLKIDSKDRAAAAAVYKKYKQPFLTTITGAMSKELLIRDEDVQVMHKFDSKEHAEAYLKSELFTKDVVTALKPYLTAAPEIRIYFAP
jgi:quinol monooxygenase YgiN